MESKSGLVWLIAPAGHSHPNDDIFLYHWNLDIIPPLSPEEIAVLVGDSPPPLK